MAVGPSDSSFSLDESVSLGTLQTSNKDSEDDFDDDVSLRDLFGLSGDEEEGFIDDLYGENSPGWQLVENDLNSDDTVAYDVEEELHKRKKTKPHRKTKKKKDDGPPGFDMNSWKIGISQSLHYHHLM